ncbi:MAG: RNase adapter RapZ [Deltaproteobacteria bacterium]|nr:RNase adapter RapZ [Desulfuromusa sp.]RLB73815.1 MAG: RNase adapter RapZ [Deltaproteobacteria bacterium]RLB79004.1 MAG: RNase adapter RapZ [Deltaproteobacteria bacterium]
MSRRLLVITGLSGSGKSTAARVLEDQGFFVVDNLPLVMLPDFMQRAREGLNTNAGVAVVIDVRNRGFLSDHDKTFVQLKEAGYQLEILFFEAADAVLQRRYSETRRRHPLATVETLQSGIEKERQQLHQLRNSATKIIDSSNLNSRQLRDLMLDFLGEKNSSSLIVNLESFGYRYGLPPAADLVFDVRFLPNPHYIDNLRPLTGLDPKLREYVLSQQACRDFCQHLDHLLGFLLPHYRAEGKSYLTVAIGCTGGRHRSVSIVENLSSNFPDSSVILRVNHRDIDKG